MNMNFKKLSWDSEFFGCSVARLEIGENCTAEECRTFLSRQHDFDVCYIFNRAENDEIDNYLIDIGAVLYDRKVTFGKKMSLTEALIDPEVFDLPAPSPEILALAVASGVKSRYFLDTLFRPKQPALYERWILNCFENPAGKVFGIYQSGVIAAVAGVVVEEQIGHLELIAVSPRFRRLGFAKKLIAAAEKFYIGSNVQYAEIVTQKDNIPACATYSSCGYILKDSVDVWHLWKN